MWKSIYKFCDNIHEFSWTVSVIKIKKEALKKKSLSSHPKRARRVSIKHSKNRKQDIFFGISKLYTHLAGLEPTTYPPPCSYKGRVPLKLKLTNPPPPKKKDHEQ